MGKVVTVTLNPGLDVLVSIPSFAHGGMNRVSRTRRDAGGKGINVSVALKNLGADSLCAGINYKSNGEIIDNYLDARGILHDFVYVEGEVRTNVKLSEEDTGVMTEINQPGEFVPEEKIRELAAKISAFGKAAANGDLLIISGSRPRGIGPDIYTRLTADWPGRIFTDMEGEAFLRAVSAPRPPYMVKPNLYELETAFGEKLSSRVEIKNLCRNKLCGKGIEIVCVSMGGDGAVLVTPTEAFYAPALDIPVRGLSGAGDSMVAGFAYGLITGATITDAFRCAVAAASASVIREGTQMCLKEDFEKMLSRQTVSVC